MAGQMIAGRYEISTRLGVGGMSTVYLAFDRRLERQVAVKLLAEHLAEDSQFVTRFRREALSVARLVHPNIVQVFDFGIDDASGRHFIVMEYVRGRSGAELLRDQTMLPVREALGIVTQACRGLDYAHRNGVVHRDVKPGNLLRADDGIVKLADFGIAKALHEESSITQAGSVLGTAAYLAPEQAHGEPAGPQADIYALGVVTYQFLSGRLPYEAQSLTELALKQQSEPPPRLDDLVAGITPQLAGAVQRALALDAADRFATAEEMRVALEEGERGIGEAPPEAVTQRIAPVTGVTSIAGADRGAEAPTSIAAPARRPREPRAAPAPPPPVAAPRRDVRDERAADRALHRRRGRRRLTALLLTIVLLGAAAIAVLVVTSNQSQGVRLRRVVYDNVQQSVDAMRQLVQDNTR
jgi:eukaryotic-like serine/threonine-protein kinase